MGTIETKSAALEAAVRYKETGFERVLRETIVSSTTDILGDLPARVLLARLELDKGPLDPVQFHNNLFSLLSDVAVILEEQVVKNLYQRLGMYFTRVGEFDFATYAAAAKSFYSSQTLEKREHN
jgi:hypothetical protein